MGDALVLVNLCIKCAADKPGGGLLVLTLRTKNQLEIYADDTGSSTPCRRYGLQILIVIGFLALLMDKLNGRASYGQHFQPDATPATPIPILNRSLNQLDRDA
jgi:hypothetical protein